MKLTNIELRQLRHVVVLARHLNFTRAASEVGLTQSALTKSIQAIEKRAQARLFDRDRNNVRLTDLGRQVVKRATELLIGANELDQFLSQSVRGEAGEVSFGMAPLPAQALLPGILARELEQSPHVTSQVAISDPDTLVRRVLAGEIEFCICAERPERPQSLQERVLASFPVSLLVRTGHPLLSASKSKGVADFPLVLSSQMPEIPSSAMPAVDFFPARANLVVDDFAILARITQASDAIWLSSAFAAKDELVRGLLVELPWPKGTPQRYVKQVLYSHARRTLSPLALRFIERFESALR